MSTYTATDKSKVTTRTLAEMKARGEKIACITAYDYTIASLVDAAGIDFILVGDSAANVMLGHSTTIPITLDEMIVYAKGVVRGAKRAFVVVDMPFGTVTADVNTSLKNAIRVIQQSGGEAVKIEGGSEIAPAIEAILAAGIPVVGHLGLTPQSVNVFGGYAGRAKEEVEAARLIADAKMLDSLGCCAIVLEKVPSVLAAEVARSVKAPIIGIGAGNGVDGQILVVQDMLGMNRGFKPKFLRHYGNLGDLIEQSVNSYVGDVKTVDFPSATECY